MATELKKFFNTVIRTASAHNLSTGTVVRITKTDNDLNGNNYYVKVLSPTSFSLYYDSGLTKIVGTNSLNITSSATIIPLFVTSLTYSFSTGGGGGGGGSSVATFAFSTSIITNIQNFNLSSALVAAGWNGTTAVTANISIDAGIYIWSDSTSVAALTINSLAAGSTVSITNNGYIIGKGGKGGGNTGSGLALPTAGGPALSLGYNITITNNSYIAGGGGGGRALGGSFYGGAGGGAGGGDGGAGIDSGVVAGGVGGALGQSGTNGSSTFRSFFGSYTGGGGGGGRILPGVGGAGGVNSTSLAAATGKGGGAGGGGGAGSGSDGKAGGSANNAGEGVPLTDSYEPGLGGGGWGALGGSSQSNPGGTGGKAISLNGYTVTYITTGTLYGAVS